MRIYQFQPDVFIGAEALNHKDPMVMAQMSLPQRTQSYAEEKVYEAIQKNFSAILCGDYLRLLSTGRMVVKSYLPIALTQTLR